MGEAITVVRIDQPSVRNAIDSDTAQRLHVAFLAFQADPDAKVAVLTGDAEAFCAGANLRSLPGLRPLVDRLVTAGTALDEAVALGEQIAASPWTCVLSDRRAVYDGLGLGLEEALANENRLGRETIFNGGFADGVEAFERRDRTVPGT